MGGDDTDLGLFGPDSVSWRVHGDPMMLVGGLRAVYLQALYPRAMAGVAQNSSFRDDPWGRLERTATYLSAVVYGTTAEAHRAAARVRRIHTRLWATDPDTGAQFRVDEPDLLRWVHVTEVDSFLTTARRSGLGLTDAEADRYVDEQRRAAALVGLDPDTVPATVAGIEEYYTGVQDRLRMTRSAAESLLVVTAPPMPWGLGYTPARAAWLGLAALSVSLLPPWARTLYGLPALPATDLTATAWTRALRLALRALPRRLREGPVYRAAQARAAAARAGEAAGPAGETAA